MHQSQLTLSGYLKDIWKRYKIFFLSLILVAILAATFNVLVNYKIKEIIDAIVANPNSDINFLLLLFILYKTLDHGMYFIRRLLNLKYKPTIIAEIITDIYLRTTKHSLHWFDSRLSGEISSKIADFQSNLDNLISNSFAAINNLANLAMSMFFLVTINKISALVVLVFMVIYTPLLLWLLKKQIKLQGNYVRARQEALGIINDSISNIFGIKVIGNVYAELRLKLAPAIDTWRVRDKKSRHFDTFYVDNADTILVIIMGAAQIYLLAHLFKAGQISAGSFAFIAMVTVNIHYVLDSLLENLSFNLTPAVASLKASFEFISSDHDALEAQKALPLQKISGEITFKNVYFAYNHGHTHIFKGLNLHIPAGTKLGIVGTSGAGKTTFVKCLLRYFDVQSGEILIDGHNIKTITQESLWANISMIPQDITMFHRSILENLQIAKYDASFAEIVEACKKARIHDDIMKMAKGYESIVGERGVKVSGGQRQRIAIARAILKSAPILILDEATSALDTPTEKLIQESLTAILASSKTTAIVIAHRLSTLLYMDKIIVFKAGQICEQGTHQQLLAKGGHYKELWDAQIGGFLPDEDDDGLQK